MKISKLLVLGTVLVAVGMTGSAFAQCSVNLTSGLNPNGGTYLVGDTVEYTVILQVPNITGSCTLSNVDVYFFPPPLGAHTGGDETITACDHRAVPGGPLVGGILIAEDLVLAPGGLLVVLTSADNPALAYIVQASDAGNVIHADAGFTFDVPGSTGQCDEKTANNNVVAPPCIEITKTANCDEATEGATVTYTYNIHNCGENELNITSITDTVVPQADIDAAVTLAGCDILAPDDDAVGGDDECEFTVNYVIPVGAPNPLENTVTVVAVDAFDQEVSDEASESVDILIPCLLLEKSCTSLTAVEPGGVAFFRISITNCGDLDLLVTITDPLAPIDSDCLVEDEPLAVGASGFCDVGITVPLDTTGPEFINSVTANWSTVAALPCVTLIEGTEDDEVPCDVAGGATRTPGFWKTHTTFAEHVLLTHCGVLDLGFVQLDTIDEICAYFWANPAKNTDGSKRSALCQARMHAAFHAIAALLNNCVPSGGGIPVSPADIATILGGTDIGAIKDLASTLAEYNESGDDVALIDPDATPGSATPQECKAYDQSIADCIEAAALKGKGSK